MAPAGRPRRRTGPQRTCVGCGRTAPAEELRRVALTVEGSLAVGRTLPGRGAWLCQSTDCVDLAVERDAFGRALRAPVRRATAQALRDQIG